MPSLEEPNDLQGDRKVNSGFDCVEHESHTFFRVKFEGGLRPISSILRIPISICL